MITMKEFLVRLLSRKFLAMVVAMVAGILAMCRVDSEMITQVVGVLTILVSAIAYIFVEGAVDRAGVQANSYNNLMIEDTLAQISASLQERPAEDESE